MTSPYRLATLFLAFLLAGLPALAADYPEPKQGSWVACDFRFHTGDVFPELKIHYRTIGAPSGEPVLLLHGTTGMATLWKQNLAELLQQAPRR